MNKCSRLEYDSTTPLTNYIFMQAHAPKTRVQLTLFLPPEKAITIENIRQQFNPIQYNLIKSHVTLCREDELIDLEKVIQNISNLSINELSINFGKVSRFSEKKGLFLPGKGPNEAFQKLRTHLLQGNKEQPSPRYHTPHITLMHPRNSTCTDKLFEKIKNIAFPTQITFHTISLIEQEIGKEWRVLKEFYL